MKECKFIIHLLYIVLLVTSCQKAPRIQGFSPDLLTETTETLNYSTFVDSIQYIHLETTDDCLIGKITDAIFTTNYILILDEQKQTIWIFNQNGKFLNKISRKGNGPEEYYYLYKLEFDKKNNQIAALDLWNHSILYYDLNGLFIRKVKFEMVISDFKIIPQGGYIISNAGESKPEAGIYLTDKNGKIIQNLIKKKPEHMLSYTAQKELYSFGDTISIITPNFENEIYHFINNKMILVYPFTFYPLLKNTYKEDISKQYLEDFIRNVHIEGPQWIFSIYWCAKHDIRNFLYSKEKKQYWIGNSLVNDIDGIKSNGKTSIVENNLFVFWCYSEEPDENPILQVLHLK